ncbi:GDPmannose 4,6-dehydratase [Conyzicola nivalis]|uniref:GDP-mannose 4,6-dehydratase n=1 Tax=Conyzicola nivalis TaxID=1477021 RepID=A0ABV2QR08_9MICO
MATAFVTGITGQDGYYLARDLVDEGVEVHALVRDKPAAAAELGDVPGIVLHEGDLDDHGYLRSLILDVAPVEIYNLGGISSVALSWQDPVKTAAVTGTSVAALLQSALELQESAGRQVRFVQASSVEIFGQAETSPQTEETPIRPTTPYGAAKAFAHHLVSIYRGRGLFASAGILYNHESPRRPEKFVSRKISMGVARIAAGLQDTIVMGTLDVYRDWGWAPDYVRALQLAVRNESPGDYVIASGEPRLVADFVQTAFALVGIDDWKNYVEIDQRFVRPTEIRSMNGDATKAREVLGWQPTTGFDEIVRRMVAHDVELLS